MCPRVSTASWSHRTQARLHDDGLSDGGHGFLQVGNQGGDLHHHHVALKQHDNTSRHSVPPTSLGWRRGRGVRQRGKQHDNTSRHSAPPTSLDWGRGRGVRQRGKQHDNTSRHSVPPTSLGWGRGRGVRQGGQAEGQTAWQHKPSLCASNITGLGEGGQAEGQTAKLIVSDKHILNLLFKILHCRKFGSPYSGKTQQSQEQCDPFLSVCAVFLCVQTMVWGFLMFTQTLMHVNACGDCTNTVWEYALKADSGRKIPCRTRDLYRCQYCAWLISQNWATPSPNVTHKSKVWSTSIQFSKQAHILPSLQMWTWSKQLKLAWMRCECVCCLCYCKAPWAPTLCSRWSL